MNFSKGRGGFPSESFPLRNSSGFIMSASYRLLGAECWGALPGSLCFCTVLLRPSVILAPSVTIELSAPEVSWEM